MQRGPGDFRAAALAKLAALAVAPLALLEQTGGARYRAQAVTAVLFGFSHILHAPVPNWRYVLLAAIAASATTHALVDAMWRTWFRA